MNTLNSREAYIQMDRAAEEWSKWAEKVIILDEGKKAMFSRCFIKHKVDTKEHPTADASVHKGSTKKDTSKDGKKEGERKPVNPIKEGIEEINEDVIDTLRTIVKKKQHSKVKFDNKKTLDVDLFTASALVGVYDKVNKKNQDKIKRMANKSPDDFMKIVDVAMKMVK